MNLNNQAKMKIQHNKTCSIIAACLAVCAVIILFPFSMDAQQSQELDRERTEQVTIVGTYDPSINQAFKINTRPELNNVSVDRPEFTFTSLEVKQPTSVEPKEIKPAAVRTGRKMTVYNNFLKLGFGSQLSPLLDFYHSSGEKNDYRLNLNVNHYASFQDIPDYSPSPFSNSLVGIGYEKYAEQAIFKIEGGYGLDMYRYFGFKPDEYPEYSPNDDALKQTFHLIKLNLGIRSNNKKEEDFEYLVTLNSYHYFDRWKKSETDIELAFDLAKPFETNNRDDFQKFGIEGCAEYGINNDSVENTYDLLIEGVPYFKAKYGIFSFKAGVNFSYLIADSSVFRFYPVVHLAVAAVPEVVTIYAGAGGGMSKNTFLKMTRENPWAISTVPIVWFNEKMRIYAGVRGNIARQLGYNIEISWQSFENMPFFINTNDDQIWPSPNPQNKFTIITDDGSVIRFSGELTYTLGNEMKLWLNGEYNSYSLDLFANPFHKPISVIGLGGAYLVKQKVNVWAEFFAYGKRYAIETGLPLVSGTEVELSGFFDINLGVDYLVTERLTVFANGTNLLNQNYERFLNYPVQGFQVMAGVAFRF
jgi:hypothetical protein